MESGSSTFRIKWNKNISNLVWIYLKDVKLYPLSNCLQYKLSQSYIHLHLVILNRNKGFWGGERSFTSFVRLGFNILTTLGLDREVFQLESFWFWQRLRSFTDCLTNWQKVEFHKFKRWIVFCFGLICICYVHGYSWCFCLLLFCFSWFIIGLNLLMSIFARDFHPFMNWSSKSLRRQYQIE